MANADNKRNGLLELWDMATTSYKGNTIKPLPTGVSLHSINLRPGMVSHACSPSLGRQRQAEPCEFKASLAYIVSSRTAKGIKTTYLSFLHLSLYE